MSCYFCGNPNTEIHHLIFGRGLRELSDKYGLVVPLCRDCHNELHHNKVMMAWSRAEGQRRFEAEHGREEFMRIFGKNYL